MTNFGDISCAELFRSSDRHARLSRNHRGFAVHAERRCFVVHHTAVVIGRALLIDTRAPGVFVEIVLLKRTK